MTRLAIIGTGYVGLTTGACFAHLGHEVVCADIDERKVERLQRGEIPIVEHRLDELVAEGLRKGNLSFVVGAAEAVKDCEIAFLCVPTPQGEDGSADLSYVETAAREIASLLPYEAIVVNKSTVPVGSTKVVERVLKRPDVRVVSNPEFLREGSAVDDFLRPDRVVVGCDDRSAAIAVGNLYDKVRAQIIVTDPASAETIKYAANAFLATKLSFINAIAAVCEGVGADVNDVVVGMGYDKRIGSEFLRPGPGWGGSCFPKDSRALLKIANEAGYRFDLLAGVITVNDEQFDRVTDKIRVAAGGSLEGKTVAVWGLTFKARTDDLRDSPSISIINRLLAAGATVQAFDPTVDAPKPGVPAGVAVCADAYDATKDADVLTVLTEWDDFRWLDPKVVAANMPGRTVVDGRNLLERAAWNHAGFTHLGIGR
ncbi:MAG: UDP-glucose/GDP-mannose dehydrogenase family protein [Actinobacteria bacterium]|nr:UDP-glucose/GDP-mannose dehydrogenase family protein [Actinomycetota bacterium]